MPKPTDKIKGARLRRPVPEPLWQGPESDGPNGGVTQSLIGRFLSCRERFRIHAVLGLRPHQGWNHKMGYGNMWHLCEEATATDVACGLPAVRASLWENTLTHHAEEQVKLFPFDREKIEHWANVCRVQFPIYVRHWAGHPDQVQRTQLLQEQAFAVPYKLPSGRTAVLRGKWDGVCHMPAHVEAGTVYPEGIWLDEHKTKGDVDVLAIQRQLRFDLQTMLYLVALERFDWRTKFDIMKSSSPVSIWKGGTIVGVRYNMVRRPLSGGKGSIVQKKGSKNVPPETKREFYGRVGQYVKDEPDHYFMRFKSLVTEGDVGRFRRECLDPVLEQMCDWWGWIECSRKEECSPFDHVYHNGDRKTGALEPNSLHWRHPYGVFNPMDEGGFGDVDAHMDEGSTSGMTRTEVLFPELEG